MRWSARRAARASRTATRLPPWMCRRSASGSRPCTSCRSGGVKVNSSHYGDSARNPLQIRSPAAPQTSPNRERTRAHPPGFFTKEKTNASAPNRELDAAQSHPKPPQGHLKATSKPYTLEYRATPRPPQGHPKATSRLPQGYPEATPKPGRGNHLSSPNSGHNENCWVKVAVTCFETG
jgi:hypothetical protein